MRNEFVFMQDSIQDYPEDKKMKVSFIHQDCLEDKI